MELDGCIRRRLYRDTISVSSRVAQSPQVAAGYNGAWTNWEGVLEQPRQVGILHSSNHIFNNFFYGIRTKRATLGMWSLVWQLEGPFA
jgi:hypothetical protein